MVKKKKDLVGKKVQATRNDKRWSPKRNNISNTVGK